MSCAACRRVSPQDLLGAVSGAGLLSRCPNKYQGRQRHRVGDFGRSRISPAPRIRTSMPCMARSGFGHAPKKSPPGKEAQNTSVCLWVTTARHADSRGTAAGRSKNMCARISLCEIPCLQGILKLNKPQVYCRVHRIHLEYPMENAVDMPSAHESAGRVNPQAALIFCSLL